MATIALPTSLLEDYGICLPVPQSSKVCGECLDHETEHIEVAIFAMNGDAIDVNDRIAHGVYNVESKSLCAIVSDVV